MTAREAILGRVRQALATSAADEDARRREVENRLTRHPRNLVPRSAKGRQDQLIARFTERAEKAQSTVETVARWRDVPKTVVDYLRRHRLPLRLRHGLDQQAAKLPWTDSAPELELLTGAARDGDAASLSSAFGAAAETGTVFFRSAPQTPPTLNFLPDHHIILLDAARIMGAYEDVWDRLRRELTDSPMPRMVNMITGPSRTGDIGQQIELGAHGPRQVHIIIAGNGETEGITSRDRTASS